MGPLSARTHQGQVLVRPHSSAGQPAGRARQEVDDGRCANEGYVFGALQPATGEVLVTMAAARTIATYSDVLDQIEAWIPAQVGRIYAIMDNLNVHSAYDVLLFSLAHPRWEFVFQPTYAAYLNLIEPWWKILKSLALKGRRFETWAEVVEAIYAAVAYWMAHRHPFVWGQRRRHHVPRRFGIASLPPVALL
jgi:transposase